MGGNNNHLISNGVYVKQRSSNSNKFRQVGFIYCFTQIIQNYMRFHSEQIGILRRLKNRH